MTNKPGEFEEKLWDVLENLRFGDKSENVEDSYAEILKLVKGIVPDNTYAADEIYEQGWSDCRLSILKALGVEA